MQKSILMMLLASSILIAGILVTGCTDSTSSVDTSSTLSAVPTLTHKADAAKAGDTGAKSQFNESADSIGTPPDGILMNITRPSGTPPDGMQMNGTRPSGTPPDGMQMNGTRPSGTPPDGIQMDRSGTPPSGTPPS